MTTPAATEQHTADAEEEIIAAVVRTRAADGSTTFGIVAKHEGMVGLAAYAICDAILEMSLFPPGLKAIARVFRAALSLSVERACEGTAPPPAGDPQ